MIAEYKTVTIGETPPRVPDKWILTDCCKSDYAGKRGWAREQKVREDGSVVVRYTCTCNRDGRRVAPWGERPLAEDELL